MQKIAEELGRQGGKIKFNVCDDAQRKCVMVNVGVGIFGNSGESYPIWDGY